jgi:MOSC domain-containing protein YiiM
MDAAVVVSVSRGARHGPRKPSRDHIQLLAGLGVEGDAHLGERVQHRSRVARDSSRPNLRQVHLIASELHDELRDRGLEVGPGEMGENVTTRGIDLIRLPRETRLRLGRSAVVEITGLRNPCVQLNRVRRGLMKATLERDSDGKLIRKAGVMGIVLASGEVSPGDPIVAELPSGPAAPLEPV